MSVLAFPFHDPKKIEVEFLKKCLPVLKKYFSKAFVSVTPLTEQLAPETVEWLRNDNFFDVFLNEPTSQVGDHFMTAYINSVERVTPEETIHLVVVDRMVKAILLDSEKFFNDLLVAEKENIPTEFIRSNKAWQTHPKMYFAAEASITKTGEILFGKKIDFAWCQITIKAEKLKKILQQIQGHDWVVQAEIAFYLRDSLKLVEVDWLSWEDPFILDKDPNKYIEDWENNPKMLEGRMKYVNPMMDYLYEKYRAEKQYRATLME